jgi:hypothetical protein
MISIIICSKNKEISFSLSNNIHDTIGCEYELIVIDNSKNQYSIFSAYNLGISKSTLPYLCLIHEDIEFQTLNWGNKIINHLNKPGTGLIGVAGGQAALRVPLGWTSFNLYYNITHTYLSKRNKIIDKKKIFPQIHHESEAVVLLDGVFMCAERKLFSHIQFDESFEGFHGYDQDISLQATIAGYINYVVYDIDLKHFSRGNFDVNYITTLLLIYDKWRDQLPIFVRSIDKNKLIEKQYKAEKNTLLRLKKRMVRAEMPYSEIYLTIRKYTFLTGNKLDKFLLFWLPVELFFIRNISIIRKKMIYQKK